MKGLGRQKMKDFTVSTDSLERLRRQLISQGRKPNTRRAYQSDAKVLTLLLMQVKLERLDLKWIEVERERLSIQVSQEEAEFIAAEFLNEEAADPERVKSCLRHLAGFRRFMASLGMVEPLKDYKQPSSPDGKPHPVEGGDATIDKMMEKADGHNEKEALVAFTGYMAFRISEARSIAPEQLDFVNWELIMIGKGGQVKRYPIPKKARRPLFMAAMTAENEGRSSIISAADRTARLWWSELLELALGRPTKTDGSEGSHSGRHTVGTRVYDKSKSLLLVQRVLRQRDIRSAAVYVDIKQSELRAALEGHDEDQRSA
jgi:integrase